MYLQYINELYIHFKTIRQFKQRWSRNKLNKPLINRFLRWINSIISTNWQPWLLYPTSKVGTGQSIGFHFGVKFQDYNVMEKAIYILESNSDWSIWLTVGLSLQYYFVKYTVNSRYLEVVGTMFYMFKLPEVQINLHFG